MAEYVQTTPPGELTAVGGTYTDTVEGTPGIAGGMFPGVDPDEAMLPAEQGAMGLVGPVTGAQHMPNAAQPGSRG